MTADMLDQDAPDVEDFLCRWLAPLLRAATERRPDDVMPFAVVARISGADDVDAGTDDPVVQVDVFDTSRDGLQGAQNAKRTANRMHRRMTRLARALETTVTLSDGTQANADTVTTVIRPFRMPYADDRVVRYVARYQVGLSYVAL